MIDDAYDNVCTHILRSIRTYASYENDFEGYCIVCIHYCTNDIQMISPYHLIRAITCGFGIVSIEEIHDYICYKQKDFSLCGA